VVLCSIRPRVKFIVKLIVTKVVCVVCCMNGCGDLFNDNYTRIVRGLRLLFWAFQSCSQIFVWVQRESYQRGKRDKVI